MLKFFAHLVNESATFMGCSGTERLTINGDEKPKINKSTKTNIDEGSIPDYGLPVSLRLNCTEVEVVVAAVQTVFLPASVNMSSPPFCNKSFDPFPLTGWSRLAVQTTVRSNDLANHTA